MSTERRNLLVNAGRATMEQYFNVFDRRPIGFGPSVDPGTKETADKLAMRMLR